MSNNFTEAPIVNHGAKNADGSDRPHCCGCWMIMGAEEGDMGPLLFAICNECGEIRDLSGPLHEKPRWPGILGGTADD